LSEVVAVLNEYPDVRIAVQAHTDNRGDAEENLQLSRRRAVSVARFFIEEGIAGQRLRPQAFGESRPRVSNATPIGRSENRRVEIIVID
jgi:outer membrane protein OmpA-like peptidoglycan-associated protein